MNINGLIYDVLYKLRRMPLKLRYRSSDPIIFDGRYIDCFETIHAVTRLCKPRCLYDIGANTGHWSYIMSQMNDKLERVFLFEPQSELCRDIQSLSMPGIEKTVYQCGLGERDEVLSIKGGTASASFMEASDVLTGYFPGCITDKEESVEVRVLDKVVIEDNLPDPDLIKLDVQGFELSVLKGAENILARTKYIILELSFRDFYMGQPPLWELLQFLHLHNFTMLSRGHELRGGNNQAEVLQMDGIFVNTNLLPMYK